MNYQIILISLFIATVSFKGFSQSNLSTNDIKGFSDEYRGNKSMRLLFWNVENLFDTKNDSITNDDEFTPEGNNHWNKYRYQKKLSNLSKTLIAAGGWEALEVICLAEIENRKVLEDLCQFTKLNDSKYEIIHKDSPDNRGIDVAMLYRSDKFEVESFEFITVKFGSNSRPTRDILRVTGNFQKQRLHVFVNHWPSRYGGHLVTEPKRMQAAQIVRNQIDSIIAQEPNANIILTGDFNDEPEDKSLKLKLGCVTDTVNMPNNGVYNLMESKSGIEGTHKYQGRWGILDHLIVSRAILKSTNGLILKNNKSIIFKAPFLLEKDKTHLGNKLNRTYIGPKYNGGYSDHLPIYVDLQAKDN